MRNMTSDLKYIKAVGGIITFLSCAAITMFSATPADVYAVEGENSDGDDAVTEETDSNVTQVKIGWYYSENFQEGMADGDEKSGYAYEYLQKIADYNGWEYEYVYGEWADLLAKLESGEIDALAGVSETVEREEYMLFPQYEMGTEKYYLYQHIEDQSMDVSDISTFSGKKIGAVKDNLMTDYLEQWAEDSGADIEIVYYDGFDERDAAFTADKLDGVVATDNNVGAGSGFASVIEVGAEPYYLAINAGRSDLLLQLNDSLNKLQEFEPYFTQNMQYECYGATVTNSELTDIENEWMNSHSVLKMGYLNNYLPYCDSDDDGEVRGLITDVMKEALATLSISERLRVEYQPFDNYDDMLEAVRSGSIDAAFPVGGSSWDIEKDGIVDSATVVSAGMDLVYKGSYSNDKFNRIAVNKNNLMQYYYTIAQYPDAKIAEYDSINECLDAVADGEASSTIVNGLRIDLVRNNSKYSSLSMIQLQKTDDRSIGVKVGNTGLLVLLNRGIKLIGDNYGTSAAYNYTDIIYKYSLGDIIRENMGFVFLIFAIFVAVILVAVYFYTRGIKLAKKKTEEQLEENQKLLEEQGRQLEEIRILNQKYEKASLEAQAASRAKTTFLFNMSHDIRTPMNAIIGFTELMRKSEGDKEKFENYLNKITSSSQFLLSLINNVLEMARIESGNTAIKEIPWSVTQFNDMLYSIFEEQMKAKNITFTRTIDVQHEYVLCDAVKLRQVFLNLLSNAYKYTNEGGSVSMELREYPSDREGYGLYRSTISDTGIGMSEDFLPHIFDEFSREHTSTECKIEGTGLGMPIVKSIVELLGGTINVESKPGEGTTFTVTLYHKISTEKALKQRDIPKVDTAVFKGKRILLAEDNDLNAEIAETILEDIGFEVERAEDGKICVDMLNRAYSDHFDLILMDIQMPNMDGYTATRVIRTMGDPVRSNIPIIAMTANAFDEDRKNALDAGMDGHLAKPIEVPRLMATLAEVLEERKE